jgi:hypothetical protein
MNGWPHAKIRTTALAYIGKHCMNPDTWRFTLIGDAHPGVITHARLEHDEAPLVSFWLGEESWYLFSTRRILGSYGGKNVEAAALDVREDHFGDFKGIQGAELELMYLHLDSGFDAVLQYETSKASMAPIYYFRYWHVKYPVLDKLKG